MKATERYQIGLSKAADVTGKSFRAASLDAGYNQNQVGRFVSGETDIKMRTLEAICEKGFGMTMETIYEMGGQ